MTAPRHFLGLRDAGGDSLAAMLTDATTRKSARNALPKGAADADAPLAGRVLACVFERPSTRTRVSFDIAMRQLGGSALVMDGAGMQLGRGESIADTARVLSRMVDAIMIRTGDHAKLEELARHASVPVINGLTELSHPCQIAADLLTVIEAGKLLPGLEVAWLGDGNNVLHSLIEAAGLMRFNLRIGGPAEHRPNPAMVEHAQGLGARIELTADAAAAAGGADVVVTDTWASMGQPDTAAKLASMQPYRVDEALMARAKPDAIFLHCLPAHVGDEVSEVVFEGPRSRVFEEAENRIHAQKAILLWCFGLL